MKNAKDWDIQLEPEVKASANEKVHASKYKKRVPMFVRLIISGIIYVFVYTLLTCFFPNFASYINTIVGIVLALASFVITSYTDYKNKIFNEIYKKDDEK